jgi:4-amino-4-deoxy-L-arabinose transferase-like glycosyltransferase
MISAMSSWLPPDETPQPKLTTASGTSADPASPGLDRWQLLLAGLAVVASVLALIYVPLDGCLHPNRNWLLRIAFVLWAIAAIGLVARIRHKGRARVLLIGAVCIGAVFVMWAVWDRLFAPYSSTEKFLENLPDDVMYSSEDMSFMLSYEVDAARLECVLAGAGAETEATKIPVLVWRRSLAGCGVGNLSRTSCIEPFAD